MLCRDLPELIATMERRLPGGPGPAYRSQPPRGEFRSKGPPRWPPERESAEAEDGD